ncbi:MAG: motility associated factor glycosyltransferase family protein [Deltaproteobacteria bacterium]|nr:motility associated factor glycosyltransferase family protein [Deltaproteobacteria bacterium]MBW2153303.1 motility associated factor glycosyltransferase family protein [Deltaproteobacteria bacterium]
MKTNRENIQLTAAANGMVSGSVTLLDGRQLFLHSRFDPEEEARFLVEKIPVRQRTLHVVLGFGLGYHVKELLSRMASNSCLLVIEPVTEQFSRQMFEYHRHKGETWIKDPRLMFHSHYDPETVPMFLADAFVRRRALSLNIFTHIPSAATNEAFYRWVLKEIQEKFPVYLEGHLGANDRILENNLSNFWANLPVTWQTPHVSYLTGRWHRKPAIIIASGPSLTNELEQLRRAQSMALLISVGSAARVLLNNGIQPHFIVSVDPFKLNMKHFIGLDTEKISLIYYHRLWRGVLSDFRGPRFWFIMNDEPPIPLAGIPESTEFWRGGTVAFSALQFAHYLKADPIIFVGLDLALHNGNTHAQGVAHGRHIDAETLPEGYFRIPGVSDNQVVTNQAYYSYLLYIQDYVQRHASVRHINTSLTGAKIHGTREMPLERALNMFCSGQSVDAEQLVRDGFKRFKPVSWHRVLKAVDRWQRELNMFIDSMKGESRLGRLIQEFRNTSVYKQISHSYDDCFFTWEVKKIRKKCASERALCERLKAHCRFVLQQLQVISEEVGRKADPQMHHGKVIHEDGVYSK